MSDVLDSCAGGAQVQLDPNVIAQLPPHKAVLEATVLAIEKKPETPIEAVKIVVQLEDGETTAEFFMKSAAGAGGAALMDSAFESETAVAAFLPVQVPRPIARGSFAADPDRHFYLCEFAHMLSQEIPPPPYDWASAVAKLHLQSMGKSPVPNHFGFGVPTFLADVPVDNTWNASWEAFWAQQMRGLFEREERLNGPDEELTRLRKAYFEKAIPRYLGPLERNGRSVVPCLLHSDLCLGNVRLLTAASGGDLCIFDACAYWGHNEADLGVCRNPRYKLGKPCIDEYQNLVPISAPRADFDGRNAVYAMKYYVLLAIVIRKNSKIFRKIMIGELRAILQMEWVKHA